MTYKLHMHLSCGHSILQKEFTNPFAAIETLPHTKRGKLGSVRCENCKRNRRIRYATAFTGTLITAGRDK